jgi:hypothetical protein
MNIICNPAALQAEAIVRQYEVDVLEAQLLTLCEYEDGNELALSRIAVTRELEACEVELFSVLEALGAL